jgi:hypothetical protein
MSPACQLGGGYFGINRRTPALLKVELIQTTTPLLLLYLLTRALDFSHKVHSASRHYSIINL